MKNNMITGNENLLQIAGLNGELISVFEKHGLGSYFRPENLDKIGKFIRLNSLLKSKKIEADQFIACLNQALSGQQMQEPAGLIREQHNLHFAAMLPCGLRNPFKEYFESLILDNAGQFGALNYLIEGNVNHELSYYPLLDGIKDENELPDIIMASDVNNFFHRPFIERFVNKGLFSAYTPHQPNPYLEKAGYADPAGNFTMFTANMLVMVIDTIRLGDRSMPCSWEDILDPCFENEIIMRGEEDFFCNAVMLPFYKDKGMDAIGILARNIKSGLHPAEMVKLAGTDKEEGGTIYIMPYFFAKRIKNKNTVIVWPHDGAIASPVFMLIKTKKIMEHRALLEFIFSKNTGEMLTARYFPSTHSVVSHDDFPQPVKWLGWDFLNNHDIGKLKAGIRETFLKIWNTKTCEQ